MCPAWRGRPESEEKQSAGKKESVVSASAKCLKPTGCRGPACRRTIPAQSTLIRAHACAYWVWLRGRSGLHWIAERFMLISWAPPGQFVVDTPSAVTVNLGCAYTLQVDDTGAGIVRTSLGWVGFKLNGHESFIPAGAACATRPKVGPGTPYFEDASARFRSALARFDFEDRTSQQRADDLAIVLGDARKNDALTLWHLLARVEEGQRVLVYDRLSRLVPPPVTVTKEGIFRLDQPMLDLWWNELGFDDISVWRYWERSWAGTAAPARKK